MKKKEPVLKGYRRRKYERTRDYNQYIKYWIKVDCVACNGTGYYDAEGSPYCGSCNGTGKERIKMPYHLSLTDVESLIGKTLKLQVGEVEDLLVYVNKRREVIYQYDNLVDPFNKIRVRSRLHFGYKRMSSYVDWSFKDRDGEEYYLSDFTVVKG